MNIHTCKIIFGPNFIEPRQGRPNVNRYHPSRKRLLVLGKQVGRKAKRVARATA
jgi:hypothetical protein